MVDNTVTPEQRAQLSQAIRWKPNSHADGNLVVLTYNGQPVALVDQNGNVVEQGTNYGPSNGYGSTWRFDRPGGAYGDIDLRVGNQTFDVPRESQNYFQLSADNASRKPVSGRPRAVEQENHPSQQPVNLLSLRNQIGETDSSKTRKTAVSAFASGHPLMAAGAALAPMFHRLISGHDASQMFDHWYGNAPLNFGGPEYKYERPNYEKPAHQTDGTWNAVETPSTRDLAAMNVGYTQNRGQAGLRPSRNLMAPENVQPYEVYTHKGGNFVFVDKDSPLNYTGGKSNEGIGVNEFSRRTGAFNHTQRVKAEEDRGR